MSDTASEHAIRTAREAVRAAPDSHVAWRSLSLALNQAGQVAEAITCCERALGIQANNFEAVVLLASMQYELGRHSEATEGYRRAIVLKPEVAALHQNLGLSLMHQSMYDAAEGPFLEAISLDPARASRSYSGLSQIVLRRGEKVYAAELLRKAHDCEPDAGMARFYLARACFQEGHLDEAEKNLRESIDLNPSFGDSHWFLGQILQQQGRFEEAEITLQKVIQLYPNRGEAYRLLTAGRKMKEEDRPFITQMRRALSSGNLTPASECSLRYALAKSLDDLGEYEAALKEYDAANGAARTTFRGRPFEPKKLGMIYKHAEAVFTKQFFRDHRSLGSESNEPIFILGMWRSGTTLAEQIVSRHPDVGAAGEMPFWAREASSTFDKTGRVIDDRRLREVQGSYLALLRSLAPGKARITDKRPGNFAILGLIRVAFPRAKIIHCKRNPVDTALSIYMTYTGLSEYGHLRENIVYAYKEYERLMKLYRRVIPAEAMLEVQYEELVSDQKTITCQILDFLDLEWNDGCLRPEENERAIETPTLWQARQPIYTSSVDRWKNYEPWLGPFRELLETGSE